MSRSFPKRRFQLPNGAAPENVHSFIPVLSKVLDGNCLCLVTDLLKHIIEGETLETFLVRDEGIFAWQRILLPIGTLVLVAIFFSNMRQSKGTVSKQCFLGLVHTVHNGTSVGNREVSRMRGDRQEGELEGTL